MVGEGVVAVVDFEQNVRVGAVEAVVEVADMMVVVAGSSQVVREDLIGAAARIPEVLPAEEEEVVVVVLLQLQHAAVERGHQHRTVVAEVAAAAGHIHRCLRT
jgi:F0F1-type ATP synthase alpha subunit